MQAVHYFDDSAVAIMRCPGHVRIQFPRLYRSTIEKHNIETALAGHDDIVAVYANPLTANVLIHFKLSLSPERLLFALGLALPDATVMDKSKVGAKKSAATSRKQLTLPKSCRQQTQEIYPAWHLCDAKSVLAKHASSARYGLCTAVAEKRLENGLNLLPQMQARSSLDILLSQFQNLPVLLLGISAVLSVLTGGITEAIAIFAVLALNGGIGYTTERRAESSIATLSELIDDIVPVLRDGRLAQVQASHIVAGDILALAPGLRVAADARLLQTKGLMVDESALTGESHFVLKETRVIRRTVALADRTNMAYMGTSVAAGTGLAVVVGTGSRTEIGAIQSLMDTTEHPKTPIQKQLDHLGNRLVAISVGVCAGVFGIGLIRGQGFLQMFKASISLAIAAVPEGLPTVATSSLARGLRLMRAKQVLIRRLQAVETLGAIHRICLDKTGTLTLNRMSAVALQAGERHYELADGSLRWQSETLHKAASNEVSQLLQICALCNESGAQHGAIASALFNGSSTENALMNLALDAGLPVADIRSSYPMLHAELRAEGRNYMKTVHALPGAHDRYLIAAKGSPLEVLSLCSDIQIGEHRLALTDALRTDIARHNEAMAEKRLRVLGFAYAEYEASGGPADTGGEKLVWLGLIGLADPLRTGAGKVIADLHRAGIRTTMITGDQSSTAYAIGKTLELANSDTLHILDAEQLDQMTTLDPPAHNTRLSEVDIFARVSPGRKLQIVQALQANGEVVAMTGDGINDGPALQAANVGIAMGLHGTDLARSAADVVLQDDRLESVLEAVRLGRTITHNIEKSLHFLISSNFSEILVVLGAISTTGTAPLTPMQLLWINLLTDVMPAIALAAEPAEADVMQQPPRAAGKPLIGARELKRFGLEGSCLAGGGLASYFYGMARYGNGPQASAMSFNTLVLGQLLHALSCRSEHPGIFAGAKIGRNNQLNLAIGGSIGLQLLANIIPGLRHFLGLSRMTFTDLAVTLAGAAIPTLLVNASKQRRQQTQE